MDAHVRIDHLATGSPSRQPTNRRLYEWLKDRPLTWRLWAFVFSYLFAAYVTGWLIQTDVNWPHPKAKQAILGLGSALLLLLATISLIHHVFSEAFERKRSAEPQARANDTSQDDIQVTESDRKRAWRVWVPVLACSSIWVLAQFVFLDAHDHDVDTRSCDQELHRVGASPISRPVAAPPADSTGSNSKSDLASPVEGDAPITFAFGVYRDVRVGARTFPLAEGASAPQNLESAFGAYPFRRDDRVAAAAPELAVGVIGDRLMVSVCVNASTFGRHPTGTFTSAVYYRTDSGTVDVAPIQVSMQARYLWMLAPLVPIGAFLAVWLTLVVFPSSLRRLWLTSLVVMAPSAAVYSAQALQNPGWNGKWQVLFTLVVSLYSAAMAAAATLKARSVSTRDTESHAIE